MRTCTILLAALLGATAMKAQTVATFDDLALHHTDTFYVNYTSWIADVGFNDGLAHFPCYYDTNSYTGSLDTAWQGGFAYSNMTDTASTPNWADSATADPRTQYVAVTGIGYGGSSNYAVMYCSNPVTFANSMDLPLTGAAIGHPVSGFYITNTSYAYSSMKYGDLFDTVFHTPSDWFLLTVKGYSGGALTADSVNFYLADSTHIVNTWQWVNLLPLGNVDSLQFSLSSSHVTSGYLDVPSYFAMDNFTTMETSTAVKNVSPSYIAKVYPNPTTNMLYVDVMDNNVQKISVLDMTGNTVAVYEVTGTQLQINTASLSPGTYILQLAGNGKVANMRFVKE